MGRVGGVLRRDEHHTAAASVVRARLPRARKQAARSPRPLGLPPAATPESRRSLGQAEIRPRLPAGYHPYLSAVASRPPEHQKCARASSRTPTRGSQCLRAGVPRAATQGALHHGHATRGLRHPGWHAHRRTHVARGGARHDPRHRPDVLPAANGVPPCGSCSPLVWRNQAGEGGGGAPLGQHLGTKSRLHVGCTFATSRLPIGSAISAAPRISPPSRGGQVSSKGFSDRDDRRLNTSLGPAHFGVGQSEVVGWDRAMGSLASELRTVRGEIEKWRNTMALHTNAMEQLQQQAARQYGTTLPLPQQPSDGRTRKRARPPEPTPSGAYPPGGGGSSHSGILREDLD